MTRCCQELKTSAGRKYSVSTGRVNSLVPGRCGRNFNSILFKLIIQNSILGIHCEITFRWMSHNLTDEKSALVQVMAWCLQAASHYLSQCWHRSMLPYGIMRPQWVKMIPPHKALECYPSLSYSVTATVLMFTSEFGWHLSVSLEANYQQVLKL